MEQKSFTLIELLVVIAIIGVISSVVLVNLIGTREKATTAKGLQFSQSVNNALGAYAVGVWSFDKIEGNTALDLSGLNNHCTIPASPYNPVPVEGIMRQALSFDGADDYIDCGNNESLKVEKGSFSVEAWFNIKSIKCGNEIVDKASNINCGSFIYGGWTLALNSGKVAFIISDSVHSQYALIIESKARYNQWVHAVGVRDADKNKIYLYVNGTLVGSANSPLVTEIRSDLSLRIGGHTLAWRTGGIIDEVRIYKEVLTAGEIKKHYTEGLEKHKLVKK